MVNLSALAKLLQFTDGWSLKLENSSYGADSSFFNSGLWGSVSKLSAVNFSLVPDPLATVVADKRGDPLPNQDSGTVFQINYPMGTYRSPGNELVKNGSVIGGADFYARPFGNTGALRALLEYDLYFPSNFPFNLGGKLPGLYGAMAGQVPSGCNGGNSSLGSNCWSLRYMWRSFGAGEIYAYIPPDNKNRLCDTRKYPLNVCSDPEYGLSLGRTSFKFATGVWNRLALHVQVNTPGQSDGYIQFYLNGEKVMENLDIAFRGSVPTDSLLVSDIFFSTFFGGSTLPYASPADTFTCFKNMNFSVSNTRLELAGSPTSQGLSSKGSLFMVGLISMILSVVVTL